MALRERIKSGLILILCALIGGCGSGGKLTLESPSRTTSTPERHRIHSRYFHKTSAWKQGYRRETNSTKPGVPTVAFYEIKRFSAPFHTQEITLNRWLAGSTAQTPPNPGVIAPAEWTSALHRKRLRGHIVDVFDLGAQPRTFYIRFQPESPLQSPLTFDTTNPLLADRAVESLRSNRLQFVTFESLAHSSVFRLGEDPKPSVIYPLLAVFDIPRGQTSGPAVPGGSYLSIGGFQ